ncbi:MAG: hypothetical protein CVU88_08345 [Firmicutes bacterium HGW-Firmicutes-13]|nr:MAG: hypothetical protein CVU88_08345 [Firmicutes bacterium HGW-Firmicutes-13]
MRPFFCGFGVKVRIHYHKKPINSIVSLACLSGYTDRPYKIFFSRIESPGRSRGPVQEALGHHKAAFTLDVYSSVTSKMKKEATEKIGNLLASCLEK